MKLHFHLNELNFYIKFMMTICEAVKWLCLHSHDFFEFGITLLKGEQGHKIESLSVPFMV